MTIFSLFPLPGWSSPLQFNVSESLFAPRFFVAFFPQCRDLFLE